MTDDDRAKALQQFAGRGKYRPLITAPFGDGAWTYATNGHAAVRLSGRTGDAAIPPQCAAVTELFTRADYAARAGQFTPFEPVTAPPQPMIACENCDGVGLVTYCETCDGTGEHECSHKRCRAAHDCGGCDGKGVLAAWDTTAGAYACETCEGSGRVVCQRTVDLGGGLTLRLHYLLKMQALPGPIEWVPGIAPETSAFRGPGWTVCIMHMRPSGHEHVQAHRIINGKVTA